MSKINYGMKNGKRVSAPMTRFNMEQALGRLEREYMAMVMSSPADASRSREAGREAIRAMRKVKALWRGHR